MILTVDEMTYNLYIKAYTILYELLASFSGQFSICIYYGLNVFLMPHFNF